MLHTDIQKQLQELSLEDTLTLAQMALEQAKMKAKPERDADTKAATAQLLKIIEEYSIPFPEGFKFEREEANER